MKNLRDRGQGFEGSRGQDRKQMVLGSEAINAYLWHWAISLWLNATGNASRVLGEPFTMTLCGVIMGLCLNLRVL